MSKISIELVMKDYDFIAPLACGDVQVEDVDLVLDRESGISRLLLDSKVDCGEMSFSKYLIRVAQGITDWVGTPIFPVRAFQHRGFFVRRGSELRSFKDLEGKNVGTNGWPETGVTTCRGALRESGASMEKINWLIGPLGLAIYDTHAPRPEFTLPPNAHEVPEGRGLVEMLLAGDIDAMMVPTPPPMFYEEDSPIVRLFPEFWQQEREFLGRVGFHPAHHLIVIKRSVFDEHPWLARNLFQAFEASKLRWQANRFEYAETSPWILADIEAARRLIGPDWQPNGVEPNRKMIEWMCKEEYEQGLIEQPLDPAKVFADFERVMNG